MNKISSLRSAKEEAKRRLEQAEKDIEHEIFKANEEVKQSIKEIAFSAAAKIVKREIDESVHQDIIDELLKERSLVYDSVCKSTASISS